MSRMSDKTLKTTAKNASEPGVIMIDAAEVRALALELLAAREIAAAAKRLSRLLDDIQLHELAGNSDMAIARKYMDVIDAYTQQTRGK